MCILSLVYLQEGKKAEYNKQWREIQLPRISRLLGTKDFLLYSGLSYVDFILHELLYVHELLDEEYNLGKDHPNIAEHKLRFEVR